MDRPTNSPAPQLVRFRQTGVTCASCRGWATGRIMVGNTAGSTTCGRHAALWLRRTAQDIANGAEWLRDAR